MKGTPGGILSVFSGAVKYSFFLAIARKQYGSHHARTSPLLGSAAFMPLHRRTRQCARSRTRRQPKVPVKSININAALLRHPTFAFSNPASLLFSWRASQI